MWPRLHGAIPGPPVVIVDQTRNRHVAVLTDGVPVHSHTQVDATESLAVGDDELEAPERSADGVQVDESNGGDPHPRAPVRKGNRSPSVPSQTLSPFGAYAAALTFCTDPAPCPRRPTRHQPPPARTA